MKLHVIGLFFLLGACGSAMDTAEDIADIEEIIPGDKSQLSDQQQEALAKVTKMAQQVHLFCIRSKSANSSVEEAISGCQSDRDGLLRRTESADAMAEDFRIEAAVVDDNFRQVARSEIATVLDSQEADIRTQGSAE